MSSLDGSRSWLMIFALLAVASSTTNAGEIFNVTPLTETNGNQPQIYGLNDKGQVLGVNDFGVQGQTTFLYDPQNGGKVSNLSVESNTPAAPGTFFPGQFNNNGQMIGYRDGQPVLSSGGSYTVLPGYPRAINDSGDVAGWVRFQNGQMVLDGTPFYSSQLSSVPEHSYISSQGVVKDLGTVPGFSQVEVGGLNNSGQASANVFNAATATTPFQLHAAYYDGQSLKDLGTLGGPTSYALGINGKGDVIGVSDLGSLSASNGQNGFVSHQGGPLVNLGNLVGGTFAQPAAINDSGEIVGTSYGIGGPRAFVYNQGVMTSLSTLLPTSSAINLTDALAINNNGQIVAEGTLKGGLYPQLFLLTPDGQTVPIAPDPLIKIVPEPGTHALFGLIAVGLIVFRRRQTRDSKVDRASCADH